MLEPRQWPDCDFVENRPRINMDALRRARNGRIGSLLAARGKMFLNEQVVVIDRILLFNGGRGDRYRLRFRCPSCDRGSYWLYEKAGAFVCRRCAGLDYRSKHRAYFAPLRRIAQLRKALDQDLDPFAPIKPRRSWRRLNYRKLLADLARAETAVYGSLGRVLDLEGEGRDGYPRQTKP